MKIAIRTLIAALGASAAIPVAAHHSYAMFDFQKTVDVKGTVVEFKYTNPHSYIVLLPQRGSKATVAMTIETNGPGYLVRNGWKRASLKPGDVITVSMNPLRDGSPGGNLIKVVFTDGRQLSAR